MARFGENKILRTSVPVNGLRLRLRVCPSSATCLGFALSAALLTASVPKLNDLPTCLLVLSLLPEMLRIALAGEPVSKTGESQNV